MRSTGVHHVSINVHDVQAARAFYCDILGLRDRGERPDLGIPGAWLEAGAGQQVHLVEIPAPPNLGQHFALVVADLDQAVEELRQRGIEVSDPSEVGGGWQSFLLDPSGNAVELHQPSGIDLVPSRPHLP